MTKKQTDGAKERQREFTGKDSNWLIESRDERNTDSDKSLTGE